MRRVAAVAAMPVLHRQRQGQSRRDKASFSIRADVLEAAREIVQAGEADNLSAFVEAALEEKVRRTRRASLYAAYETAAQDRAFTRDMQNVTRAFENVGSDGI